MKAVFALLALAVAVSAMPMASELFEQFKAEHAKVYSSAAEEATRKAIFQFNLEKINKHNEEYAAGVHTYTMGVNEFADLTADEFKAMYTTRMPIDMLERPRNEVFLPTPMKLSGTEDSVDWRTKNAVTPVKNQGQCGSCWSFSTTGSVEGAHAIATGKLVSLSEQQLMDCSTAEGNQGCNGGLMDDAFQYIIKNGGLDTEEDYPYTARDGRCNKNKEKSVAADITGFQDVPVNSEAQLAAAVAKGPVSVAIEADQSGFQFYSGGVFSGSCGTQLDHGVLAVGYGTQGGQDYWIVKNSWGSSWGMDGYILLARNIPQSHGQCGIAMAASYPTGASSGKNVEAPAAPHYEDPKPNGCQSDEQAVQVTGVSGDFCSPACSDSSPCPTDYPSGASGVSGECILEAQGSSQPTNCVLVCQPGENDGCPTGASCKAISTIGICTYDD